MLDDKALSDEHRTKLEAALRAPSRSGTNRKDDHVSDLNEEKHLIHLWTDYVDYTQMYILQLLNPDLVEPTSFHQMGQVKWLRRAQVRIYDLKRSLCKNAAEITEWLGQHDVDEDVANVFHLHLLKTMDAIDTLVKDVREGKRDSIFEPMHSIGNFLGQDFREVWGSDPNAFKYRFISYTRAVFRSIQHANALRLAKTENEREQHHQELRMLHYGRVKPEPRYTGKWDGIQLATLFTVDPSVDARHSLRHHAQLLGETMFDAWHAFAKDKTTQSGPYGSSEMNPEARAVFEKLASDYQN